MMLYIFCCQQLFYLGTGRGYNDSPGPPGPPGPPGHISVNDVISLLQSQCF